MTVMEGERLLAPAWLLPSKVTPILQCLWAPTSLHLLGGLPGTEPLRAQQGSPCGDTQPAANLG